MWKSRFSIPATLTLMVAMALPVSALADSHANKEIEHLKRENAEMKQMLMRMQEQLQEVMMKTNAMQQQAKKAAKKGDKKGGMVKPKKEDITISTTGGGIKVKSSEGNQFKIGGQLMYDFDSYDDFWEDEDGEENEIRQSRITLSGKSGKNWSYKFTTNIDHEDETASVDTGYLKYSSNPMYVKLGKYKRPGMLEERTSSKWLSTIERSIMNELSGAVVGKPAFGGVEVGFGTKGDLPMSGAIGIYDDEIDEPDGSDVYGVGARFSIMPKFGDNSFLHAGASFYSVDYKGTDYRMHTRMGVHTTGRPFETDRHQTDDIDQLGVELAYVNGPFSLQGEFMNVESDGTNNSACGSGVSTPEMGTGESENYLVMLIKQEDDGKGGEYMDQEVDLGDEVDLSDYMGCEPGADVSTCESFGAAPGNTDAIGAVKEDDFIVRKRSIVAEEAFEGFDNTCDLEMDGFYLQAAYTLTGETRGYKAGSGAFAAIKPKGEGGAWELVARYEDADIDVPGRSLSADLERLVLGVNWYVNKNVKFMLNYVDSEVDGCSTSTRAYALEDGTESGESEKLEIKKCNNDDGDAISLRGQYVF